MKLLRIGERGAETPCVMDTDGRPRDISSIVPDIGPQTVEVISDLLLGVDTGALPLVESAGLRIGPPMAQPRNIYCIGLNYRDHAEEAKMAIPDEPILFTKASGTFCGPNDPILHVPSMSKLDWEAELGVVIGRTALNVSESEALDHVLGYTIVNDVSERHWQLERSGQWSKGKSFPNFCPTGPWIVTPDEAGDPQNLSIWLDVNSERMQDGSTATMIFGVATIVSYLSRFMRLEPGDLIATGTPPGVGMGKSPQRWLAPGDEIRLGVEGLGEQHQRVVPMNEAA